MWQQVQPTHSLTDENPEQDVEIDHVSIPGENQGIWKAESLGLYLARTKLTPWGTDDRLDFLWFAASLKPIHDKLRGETTIGHGRVKPSWLWHINSGSPAEILDKAKSVLGSSEYGENHATLVNALRKEIPQLDALKFTAESDGPFYDTDHVPEYVEDSSPSDEERAFEGLIYGAKYQKYGDTAGECSVCGRTFHSPEVSCKIYAPTSPEFPVYLPDMKRFVACNEHDISSLSEVPYVTLDNGFAPFQVPEGLTVSDDREERFRHLGPCGGFATEDLLIECDLEWLSTGAPHSGVLVLRDATVIDRVSMDDPVVVNE